MTGTEGQAKPTKIVQVCLVIGCVLILECIGLLFLFPLAFHLTPAQATVIAYGAPIFGYASIPFNLRWIVYLVVGL